MSPFYDHWFNKSGIPLTYDFSNADISGLAAAIEQSSMGKNRAQSFRIAIEDAVRTGRPTRISTNAPIDIGGTVAGRVDTKIRGWVTASNGRWSFRGNVIGQSDKFNFDASDRRVDKELATRAMGGWGWMLGAKDFYINYGGSIGITASGQYGPR